MKVRLEFDCLESIDLRTMIGPQFAPGVLKGTIPIETFSPAGNIVEATNVAIDSVEGKMPSRAAVIAK